MTHVAPVALCICGTTVMVIGFAASAIAEEAAPLTVFAMQVASTLYLGAIAWSLAS